MWLGSKKKENYTVKDWSIEIIKFSAFLLIVNTFFLWQVTRDGWGINFTLGPKFDPTHALWGFFFEYYYPFLMGSIPYAVAVLVCGFYLRKFKDWARVLLIPLSILAGICVTILYIFLLKEFVFWPLYLGFVVVVTITLFWSWKYIFKLVKFLRNPIVVGLFE